MDFLWGHQKRYNDFSTFFRKKFSERVQKVSIDAGFTCPNRDGTKGQGGCSYCNNKTFNPSYCNLEISVTSQIEKGIGFFAKKYDAMKFLAYFQAYTNTYAPFEDLKRLYEEALQHPKIMGLVISTRPDTISEELLEYLAELSKKTYVMVEIGLESHLDKSLERINRGHTFAESVWALNQTSVRGINNCAHLILGLPGENKEMILSHAQEISKLPLTSVKLHQLQLIRHTKMAKQFEEYPEKFRLYSVDEYIELCIDFIERLNPEFVLERFVSQSPKELLIAPDWGLKNFEFTAKVNKRIAERSAWQGRLI